MKHCTNIVWSHPSLTPAEDRRSNIRELQITAVHELAAAAAAAAAAQQKDPREGGRKKEGKQRA